MRFLVVGNYGATVFFRLSRKPVIFQPMDNTYQPEQIEAAAREYWETEQTFRVSEDPEREKY